MMDLIDRYLASVRRNLPRNKADDIAEELEGALEARRDDREAELGRPLSEAETSALLREFGHPLVIAARYRQHQYLIGPAAFPFYLFTLKVVLAAGAALLVGFVGFSMLMTSQGIAEPLARTAGNLAAFVICAVGTLTIIFALLERRGFPDDHLSSWRPEQLPAVMEKREGSWNAAVEAGLGVGFLLWWSGLVPLPAVARGSGLVAPGPVWDLYYWPILLLVAFQLAANLLKWLRPGWSRLHGLLAVAASVATLAIVAGLYLAGSWATAKAGAPDPSAAAQLAAAVDQGLRIAFVVLFLATLFRLVGEVRSLVRLLRAPASGRAGPAPRAAAGP